MSALERIERNELKWFRHVERMGEERLVKRVYQANVEITGGELDLNRGERPRRSGIREPRVPTNARRFE